MFLVSGCNSDSKYTKKWYSDKEENDYLILNNDGTFNSEWLGNGTYEIKDDTINLISSLDNKEVTLYIRDESKLDYSIGDSKYTYYDNKENALEAYNKRENEKINNVKKSIVGTWEYSDSKKQYIYSFFEDGTFEFSKYEKYEYSDNFDNYKGFYEVEINKMYSNSVDAQIHLKLDNGTQYFRGLSIIDDETINILELNKSFDYKKK